jgi:hypothetical protein
MKKLYCRVRGIFLQRNTVLTVVLLLITACVRNVAAIALRTGYRSLTHRPTWIKSAVHYEHLLLFMNKARALPIGYPSFPVVSGPK